MMDTSGDGDLKQRSVRGGIAVVVAGILHFCTTLATVMVLARLLTPSDFGLLAMAAVLSGFVGSFRDFGLPMAIVWEDRIDDDGLSRVFWLNAKLAGALGLAMAAASPLLAWLFGEPALIAISCALAVGMAANGLSNPHVGLLKRQMRFRLLGTIDVGAAAMGGVCGIGSALLGAGYWSLVIQQLAELGVQGALRWLVSDWRPGSVRTYGRSGPELRALLSFGRETTLARVLNEAAGQIDRILVGTLAGATQLGFYQNARRWSELPALQLVVPIKSVAVASFSRLQREPERYRAAARSVFAAAFAAVLPLMAFLCVEAKEVILFLFGPKWLAAVPFFRLLAAAVFFGCANRLTVWVYLSEGETRRRLQWTVISQPLTIGAVMVGAAWGPLGIVVAVAVVTALLAYPSVRFCLRTSPLREADVWGAAWRPAVAGGGAAALLVALPATSDTALALRLLRDGAIFGVACAAIWMALPGGLASARDLLQLLRSAGPIRRVQAADEGVAARVLPGATSGPLIESARHELLGGEIGGRRS